ncbi:MAG: hypothetical protein Tsb005_04450 [Gammaproteobacteria bacterium]
MPQVNISHFAKALEEFLTTEQNFHTDFYIPEAIISDDLYYALSPHEREYLDDFFALIKPLQQNLFDFPFNSNNPEQTFFKILNVINSKEFDYYLRDLELIITQLNLGMQKFFEQLITQYGSANIHWKKTLNTIKEYVATLPMQCLTRYGMQLSDINKQFTKLNSNNIQLSELATLSLENLGNKIKIINDAQPVLNNIHHQNNQTFLAKHYHRLSAQVRSKKAIFKGNSFPHATYPLEKKTDKFEDQGFYRNHLKQAVTNEFKSARENLQPATNQIMDIMINHKTLANQQTLLNEHASKAHYFSKHAKNILNIKGTMPDSLLTDKLLQLNLIKVKPRTTDQVPAITQFIQANQEFAYTTSQLATLFPAEIFQQMSEAEQKQLTRLLMPEALFGKLSTTGILSKNPLADISGLADDEISKRLQTFINQYDQKIPDSVGYEFLNAFNEWKTQLRSESLVNFLGELTAKYDINAKTKMNALTQFYMRLNKVIAQYEQGWQSFGNYIASNNSIKTSQQINYWLNHSRQTKYHANDAITPTQLTLFKQISFSLRRFVNSILPSPSKKIFESNLSKLSNINLRRDLTGEQFTQEYQRTLASYNDVCADISMRLQRGDTVPSALANKQSNLARNLARMTPLAKHMGIAIEKISVATTLQQRAEYYQQQDQQALFNSPLTLADLFINQQQKFTLNINKLNSAFPIEIYQRLNSSERRLVEGFTEFLIHGTKVDVPHHASINELASAITKQNYDLNTIRNAVALLNQLQDFQIIGSMQGIRHKYAPNNQQAAQGFKKYCKKLSAETIRYLSAVIDLRDTLAQAGSDTSRQAADMLTTELGAVTKQQLQATKIHFTESVTQRPSVLKRAWLDIVSVSNRVANLLLPKPAPVRNEFPRVLNSSTTVESLQQAVESTSNAIKQIDIELKTALTGKAFQHLSQRRLQLDSKLNELKTLAKRLHISIQPFTNTEDRIAQFDRVAKILPVEYPFASQAHLQNKLMNNLSAITTTGMVEIIATSKQMAAGDVVPVSNIFIPNDQPAVLEGSKDNSIVSENYENPFDISDNEEKRYREDTIKTTWLEEVSNTHNNSDVELHAEPSDPFKIIHTANDDNAEQNPFDDLSDEEETWYRNNKTHHGNWCKFFGSSNSNSSEAKKSNVDTTYTTPPQYN